MESGTDVPGQVVSSIGFSSFVMLRVNAAVALTRRLPYVATGIELREREKKRPGSPSECLLYSYTSRTLLPPPDFLRLPFNSKHR